VNQNKDNNGFFSLRLKFNIKSLIILVLFGLGLYLLLPKLINAEEALRLIVKVNKFYLILAILFEVLSYCGAAWLSGIILFRLGYKISFLDRFRLGSIAAFAIHFFPLGSFGEGAIEYYFLHKRSVSAGSVLIMFMLRIFMTYLAFLLLFFVGLVLIPTLSLLSPQIKFISAFLAALILWGIWYTYHLYKRKEKFWRRWWGFIQLINFFIAKIKYNTIKESKARELFEDIYKGIRFFKSKKRFMFLAFLAALVYWLGDIACLLFVFLSFGRLVDIGILLFGYGVATLVSLISFVPGGLGVTEGSLGLIYAGAGIPVSLALMTILIFRFFSFWIWVPIGFISYITLKREQK